jgi:hypothetical protein
MTTTMQLIAKQTVGSGGASSVTFSNIPQTFTDLKVVCSIRSNRSLTNDSLELKPNGSTSSRAGRVLLGDGSSPSSTTTTGEVAYAALTGNTATASVFSNIEIYCPNYTSSNYKSFSSDGVTENNATTAYAALNAWLWSNTAAITSLEFVSATGNSFMEYSEFWLYGISNSTTNQATTVPYASGGDVITTDGSYWYHAFKYSGSFTPLKNLTADVLVVAGGGGSGGSQTSDKGSAGGGAGGIIYFAAQALTNATNYTCSVGAGGAAGASSGSGGVMVGSNGGNSVFGALTAGVGGGGGAAGYGADGPSINHNGKDGGSGGGSTRAGTIGLTTQTGTGATAYYGFNGGEGQGGTNGGAGGGGAGQVGFSVTGGSNAGVNGGAGINTYSSWASATSTGASGYFAGGGGGGSYSGGATTGGAGGGGNGGAGGGGQGTAGTANTGGGGGGTGGNASAHGGNNGGSGIIIVRYAV